MFSTDEFSSNGRSLHHNTGQTGSVGTVRIGSRIFPVYQVVTVCLGLSNILLLLAAFVIGIYCGKVTDELAPYYETSQGLISELRQLQTMHRDVIQEEEEARQAMEKESSNLELIKQELEQHKSLSDALQSKIEAIVMERAALQANISEMQGSCGQCLPGWFLWKTTCYLHAKSPSYTPKNWTDSRADCISRGADLTVIDTWEEQEYLYDYLPKLDRSIRPWWRDLGTWIGITDNESEGTWVWINNVTVVNGGYWIPGEPNNAFQSENCGAIMNIDNPRRTWFDGKCDSKRQWLCEKQLN